MTMKRLVYLLVLIGLCSASTVAAQPIEAAEVLTDTVAGALAPVIERSDVDWVIWRTERALEVGVPCCWRRDGRGCDLDENNGFNTKRAHDGDEGLLIYVKSDGSAVRAFAPSCPVNALESRVLWLDGVTTAQSAEWLRSRLAASTAIDDDLLAVLAMHAHEPVTGWLETYALEGPESRAEDAVFWLGHGRGVAGHQALLRLLDRLSPGEVRREIAFALGQSSAPGALDSLIDLARHDDDADMRKEAVFWLAQEAGARATAAIGDSVAEDPDLEVKRAAVFALGQLPTEQGVPRLIALVRDHPSAVIRKEALFWLGESGDERALDFIVDVLESE